jgi:hypothetical protein
VSTLQEAFAERFGADQAAAIVAAAEMHDNDAHDNRGSEPFRWALSIAIGYECFTNDGYREYHGITAPADDIKAWIKAEADLGSHDGDVDYLGAICGAYDEYVEAAR